MYYVVLLSSTATWLACFCEPKAVYTGYWLEEEGKRSFNLALELRDTFEMLHKVCRRELWQACANCGELWRACASCGKLVRTVGAVASLRELSELELRLAGASCE